MASRSETFLADEILATNEAVVQTNQRQMPRKRRTLACRCYWWVESYFHAEFAAKVVKIT